MGEKQKNMMDIFNSKALQLFPSIVMLLVVIMFSTPSLSKANPQKQDGDWEFAAELYLWGASIDGETATGDNLDIGIDDLLDGLNLAFMGTLGAKKDRWGFMIDTIYLDASDNRNVNTSIGGVNTNVELSSWVVTPMIGYEVVNSDMHSLSIIGGVRYLYLDTEIGLRNADPAGPFFSVNAEDSGDKWDGIIGLRGEFTFATNWFIPYHLDIGTGDSDFTWQGFAGIGYHFSYIDLLAGYRYLSWDFDDNTAIDDMNLSGFGAGIKFKF